MRETHPLYIPTYMYMYDLCSSRSTTQCIVAGSSGALCLVLYYVCILLMNTRCDDVPTYIHTHYDKVQPNLVSITAKI